MKIILGGIAFVIAAGVAAALSGSSAWQRATEGEEKQLSTLAQSPGGFDAAVVDAAPAPVARYLRKAIPAGHALVQEAVATQSADFFLNNAWRRLRATQRFSASPPGFVWDAHIEMAPLVPIYVRDSYLNGRARMRASLCGLYTIVDQFDRPELNAGALQRFLGEAIWLPTALLPSSRLTWQARDERSAYATLVDGPTRATLLFEFGDDDLPQTISGDRFKEHNGEYALAPWQIRCGEPAVRGGFIIPLQCDVAWITGGARQSYWRGRITSIDYRYEGIE